MTSALTAAFVLIPFVEIVLILAVADEIGVGPTIFWLIAISVIGAYLAKREGLAVWSRLRAAIQRGEMPSREVTDGFLILLGGALLLTPGFLTDVLGVLLVFPPTRGMFRARLLRRFEARLRVDARPTPVRAWRVDDAHSEDSSPKLD